MLADSGVCTINLIPAIPSDRAETNSGKSGKICTQPVTGNQNRNIFFFMCSVLREDYFGLSERIKP